MSTYLASLNPRRALLVNGEFSAGGGGVFPVHDPSTGDVIAHVSDGDMADAHTAADAAECALPAWGRTSARERSEILRRMFGLLHRDIQHLSELIVAENGKSLDDAVSEVRYAAEFFRWYAEEGVRSAGQYGAPPGSQARTVVTHRPVGVAALITPWNFPAAMAARKIAPALAAGCTVVLKPAAETPLTALAMARLLRGAGVPPGVVNVVPTTDPAGVVTTWLQHDRVRKISFTGSTSTGQLLLRQAADRVLNASMELGGNAPFIVTEEANIESAVAGAMIAKFRNGGQACTAANRFYIHRRVLDSFVCRFGELVENLKVGPGLSGADIGPLISERAVTRVDNLVCNAISEGARVSHRTPVPVAGGWYYPPTVLADVIPGSSILSQEIFAPVAPIVAWDNESDLIAGANASEMGLAAYVYAGNLQHAMRLGESLEVGMVAINRGFLSDPSAPFGGVKQSGLGREGARAGLEEFLETQYFSIDWDE